VDECKPLLDEQCSAAQRGAQTAGMAATAAAAGISRRALFAHSVPVCAGPCLLIVYRCACPCLLIVYRCAGPCLLIVYWCVGPCFRGISIWDMCYRYGIWYIDIVIYHIDMVILDVDMGYGLMIWEMTVSIRLSPISILVTLAGTQNIRAARPSPGGVKFCGR